MSIDDMAEEEVDLGIPVLLSFVSNTDLEFIDGPEGIKPGSIWDDLLKGITERVKLDGIQKEAILPGETAASVTVDASENIYYDVAEFYHWYFDEEDWAGRNQFIKSQKVATVLNPLRALVKVVVEYNLRDMREAELIPEGMDVVDDITDNLTRYILNWQDWYYDRKEQEEFEDELVDKSIYEDVYGSDYGDYTNITNYLDDY